MSSREAARATRSMLAPSSLAGIFSARLLARRRQLREVLGGEDAQVEAGAAAADLDVVLGLARLDLDRRVGERARDLGQQPAGQQHRALGVDLGGERRLQAHVEIGGGERHPALGGGEEDAGEGLGGGARRYSPGDDRELGDEFFAFGRELQVFDAFLSWVRACGKGGGHGGNRVGTRFRACGGGCGKEVILAVPSAVSAARRRDCG